MCESFFSVRYTCALHVSWCIVASGTDNLLHFLLNRFMRQQCTTENCQFSWTDTLFSTIILLDLNGVKHERMFYFGFEKLLINACDTCKIHPYATPALMPARTKHTFGGPPSPERSVSVCVCVCVCDTVQQQESWIVHVQRVGNQLGLFCIVRIVALTFACGHRDGRRFCVTGSLGHFFHFSSSSRCLTYNVMLLMIRLILRVLCCIKFK